MVCSRLICIDCRNDWQNPNQREGLCLFFQKKSTKTIQVNAKQSECIVSHPRRYIPHERWDDVKYLYESGESLQTNALTYIKWACYWLYFSDEDRKLTITHFRVELAGLGALLRRDDEQHTKYYLHMWCLIDSQEYSSQLSSASVAVFSILESGAAKERGFMVRSLFDNKKRNRLPRGTSDKQSFVMFNSKQLKK